MDREKPIWNGIPLVCEVEHSTLPCDKGGCQEERKAGGMEDKKKC
jgi:hypothetical protein